MATDTVSNPPSEVAPDAARLTKGGLRALFSISVTESFFRLPRDKERAVGGLLKDLFDDLQGRFDVRVLGTLDNDLFQVGAFPGEPTSFILVAAPSFESVISITNIARTRIDGSKLAGIVKIQARIGHELFFGTN